MPDTDLWQFVGIDAFVYYAPTFFTQLGQTDDMARILTGIINVAQFAGICNTCFYSTRWVPDLLPYGSHCHDDMPHRRRSSDLPVWYSLDYSHICWMGLRCIHLYIYLLRPLIQSLGLDTSGIDLAQ